MTMFVNVVTLHLLKVVFLYCDQGARAASRNLSSKLHKLDQESLKQQEIIYMQVSVATRIDWQDSLVEIRNTPEMSTFSGFSHW